MDMARTWDVLVVCLPVFAAIGLGKLLGRNGRITSGHCAFINWLVYTFSLPALIFNAVARQRFSDFLDPVLVLMPLLALVVVALAAMLFAKLRGYRKSLAAAVVFGTFWANATYIGFPLCINAFGAAGEAKAAVYNAFVLPFFIVFGYLVIGLYGAGDGEAKIGRRIAKAFANPILLSAVAGVLVALVAGHFRDGSGTLQLPRAVTASAEMIGSFLKLIGAMGLPLALLSIGASLRKEMAMRHLDALGWALCSKLVLLPLATLLLIRFFYPDAQPVSQGVAVILAGTPTAVACYVICCQLGIETAFVSALLVATTAASVLTIPLWIYFVL